MNGFRRFSGFKFKNEESNSKILLVCRHWNFQNGNLINLTN